MVPGRKFSRTTSLIFTRSVKILRAAGALRLRVTLFLLRFTDMKYVASPPTKGGQLRVSSPLPGSSILTTSAPMSPSSIAQNGPARTRVRSSTRTPARGPFARGTLSSSPDALGEAPRDRVHAVAGVAGAPPEQPRAVHDAKVGEVVHAAHRLDRDRRADPEPPRLRAVADEPRAPLELDERDVERRLEARGRRVQRGERDDLTRAGERHGLHRHGMVWTVARRRRDDRAARRAPGGVDPLDHAAVRSVTQLFVASPPMEWAS